MKEIINSSDLFSVDWVLNDNSMKVGTKLFKSYLVNLKPCILQSITFSRRQLMKYWQGSFSNYYCASSIIQVYMGPLKKLRMAESVCFFNTKYIVHKINKSRKKWSQLFQIQKSKSHMKFSAIHNFFDMSAQKYWQGSFSNYYCGSSII